MSERPETDKAVATGQQAASATTSTAAGTPKTVEKPGTGRPEQPEPEPPQPEPVTGKSTFYGRDEYPDGYVMHHEQGGSITLDNPDGTRGRWNPDDRMWVDLAGHPMPEGWDGGHRPGTAFDSGPASSAPGAAKP